MSFTMNKLNTELSFWVRVTLFYLAFILSNWLASFESERMRLVMIGLISVLLVLVVWRNWLRFTQEDNTNND